MTPPVNKAVEQIPASGIRRIVGLADEVRDQGRRVYPFHLGRPSFDTPEPIKTSAIRKLQEGFVHYTPNAGISPLREAIAASVNRRRRANIAPSSVIVTVGACEALSIALMATLESGDELIVSTPCWPNYLQLPTMLGARAVEVPAMSRSGFLPDPSKTEAQINERTKAVLINTPNNPTGAVMSSDTMTDILEIARRHKIWLIVDEIYEDIVYEGYTHTSALSLAGGDEAVIAISGLSKTYSMTGWRLGYIIAPSPILAAMLKVHQYLVTSACSFAQWGGVTAVLDEPGKEHMRREYETRRSVIINGLREAGLDFTSPGGSFYVFPTIPDCYPDDQDFCHHMLTNHGVALVPGSVFGRDFGRYFRLCFACETEDVIDGMQALLQAL